MGSHCESFPILEAVSKNQVLGGDDIFPDGIEMESLYTRNKMDDRGTAGAVPHEIISLHLGQCGNQVGKEYWKKLCLEHQIGPNGLLLHQDHEHIDRKSTFFLETQPHRFTPRALLIDSEPRAVTTLLNNSSVSHLFDPDNVYIYPDGSGAGNCWSTGFECGETASEYLLEMVQREAEAADLLSGFHLFHSLGGGTGSGMGSFFLELLTDRYPQTLLQSHSVFPSADCGDVVVNPYNTILSLKRLALYADAVTVIDNQYWHAVSQKVHDQGAMFRMNSSIAAVIAASTLPYRCISPENYTMDAILSLLVPAPRCHFLVPTFAPLSSIITRPYVDMTAAIKVGIYPKAFEQASSPPDPSSQAPTRPSHESERSLRAFSRGYSLNEICTALLKPTNKMISSQTSSRYHYLAMVAFFSGFNSLASDHMMLPLDQMHNLTTSSDLNLLPQGALGVPQYKAAFLTKPSPRLQSISPSAPQSGILLSNDTSIVPFLQTHVNHFRLLRERNAFLTPYLKSESFPDGILEMDDSLEVVLSLLSDYNMVAGKYEDSPDQFQIQNTDTEPSHHDPTLLPYPVNHLNRSRDPYSDHSDSPFPPRLAGGDTAFRSSSSPVRGQSHQSLHSDLDTSLLFSPEDT